MFRLGVIATDGRMIHQAICPLQKEIWLDGCLGVEPRRVWITLADVLLGGESFWLKGSMIGVGEPCTF
jgi:hypothetical protein